MMSAWIGALTSDMKNPAAAIPAIGTYHGAGSASDPQRRHLAEKGRGAERERVGAAHDPHRHERADERAAAERAEQPAENAGVRRVLRHDEHGQRRENAAASTRRAAVSAGVQTRSSLSRSRNRTPSSTPAGSAGVATSGGWTNAAISANETTYVAAST